MTGRRNGTPAGRDGERGVALLDFLQGSMIFMAFTVIFFGLSQGKMAHLGLARSRTQAIEAATTTLEETLARDPAVLRESLREAGPGESVLLGRFEAGVLLGPEGREPGTIRVREVPDLPGVCEVVVRVEWVDERGLQDRVQLGSLRRVREGPR